MRLGIFAKTFPGSAPGPVLRQAHAAGFAAVQYNMACSGLPSMPDAIAPGVAAAVWQAAGAEGLAVAAVSGTYNMIHPDKAVRAAGLRRLEVLAGACAGMGTSLITLCTGTRDPDDQWRGHPDNGSLAAWRDLLAELEVAIGIAERHHLRLGIEPELSNVIDSAAKARLLLDTLKSPVLTIVLDPANLFETATLDEQRELVSAAVELVGEHLIMGHAKDRAGDGSFVAAGTGAIDFPHFIGRLRAAGFDGDLVAHGLSAAEAPGVARYLAEII
jgi:sugar phosphate isomerase/epimerase